MIQAYRRGMLQPAMPFGRRSRLRETILLDAIEAENVVRLSEKKLLLTATVVGAAPIVQQARMDLIRNLGEDLKRIDLLRFMDFDGAEALAASNSALAIAAVYEMLERSGALETPAST